VTVDAPAWTIGDDPTSKLVIVSAATPNRLESKPRLMGTRLWKSSRTIGDYFRLSVSEQWRYMALSRSPAPSRSLTVAKQHTKVTMVAHISARVDKG
jgi:hypothetical protein